MSDTSQKHMKPSSRSSDFRYIPCDALNLAISDNGIKLILGVEELDGTTLELAGVHFTHRTAMLLRSALNQALDHYEKATGIKLDEPELKPT